MGEVGWMEKTRHKECTMKKILIISNENSEVVESLTAESNNYQVAADTMLIPYGDHPHKNGVQRFTREHADSMVSNFNGFLSKLGRLFGGLPVYIGHPDDPAFSNQHTDSKSYAWIMGMEARDDGLALIPKWSKPGEEIVSNAHYKFFSPRWACKPIGQENGKAILAPIRLISVGLTNIPQIAGIPPLANETIAEGAVPPDKPKETGMELLKKLLALLGLAETCTEEDCLAEIGKMKTGMEAASTEANQAKAELANAQTNFQAERGARIEMLISNALVAGILTPAQKEQWLNDLANNFAEKTMELSNMKPAMNVTSQTKSLGSRKPETLSNRDRVLTLVNERMDKNGEDYETAFAAVRKENQGLFDVMKQPAKPTK
jgi:hypothetical protein